MSEGVRYAVVDGDKIKFKDHSEMTGNEVVVRLSMKDLAAGWVMLNLDEIAQGGPVRNERSNKEDS